MSNRLDTEGKFTAIVIEDPGNGLFEAGDKQTPGIRLWLAITDDGPDKGKVIDWTGWLTDGAFENTNKALTEAFGFDGDYGAFSANGNLFQHKECSITTEFEEYKGKSRLKVRWLNPVGGGAPAPLDPAAARGLAAKLTARAAALRKAAGQPAPAAKPASRPNTPGGDDEIPY